MSFIEQISNYVLGFFDEKSIPKIGITALEEGVESDNIVIIAGMLPTDNPFELKEYFLKALKENNILLPSKEQALKNILSPIINKILSKKVTILDGCIELNYIVNRTPFDLLELNLKSIYLALTDLRERDLHDFDSKKTKNEILKELKNYTNHP